MSRFMESDSEVNPPPPPRRRETLPARFGHATSTPTNSPGYIHQPLSPQPMAHNQSQNPYFTSMNTGGPPPPALLRPYYFPPSMYYMGARPETITLDQNLYGSPNNLAPSSQFTEEGTGQHRGRVVVEERTRNRGRRRDRIEVRRRSSTRDTSTTSSFSEEDEDDVYGNDSELHNPRAYMDIDDYDSSVTYSFTPSREVGSRVTHWTGITEEDISEDTRSEARLHNDGRRPRTTHVFESKYTGESYLGGSHTAKLTAVSSTNSQNQSLFRWVHFTQSSMDFDSFSNEASHMPELTKVERTAITNILGQVKRKFVKSIQTSSGRNVQKMEPACIQHVLPSDGSFKGQTITPRTVTWVCLPYFSLEPYSGLLSAKSPSEFPIQTILQAQFSRATQERDMQQAVCHDKNCAANLCFHIAQLWCLVLDNALLLTCSRVTEETLCADLISKSTNIPESVEAHRTAKLSVRYQGSVIWSIPVDKCQTWLGFLSHFTEFWPNPVVFFRNRQQVIAEEWPNICHLAKSVHTRIILDLKIGTPPNPPPRGLLTPRSESQNASESATTFSIFAGLNGVTSADLDHINQPALENHLSEAERYLLHMTSFGDRRAYRECPKASRETVYALLEQQESELSRSDNAQSTQQRDYEDKIDVFNTADMILNVFFPLHIDAPTVDKYWGAVKMLVEKTPTDGLSRETNNHVPKRYLRLMRSVLRELTITLTLFSNIFSHSQKADRLRIQVPDELIRAWIHLVMGLIYIPRDFYKTEGLIGNAKSLIDEGISDIVKSLSEGSLLESSAILPLEIVSLMSLNLFQDITPGLPNISRTYSSYLNSVESDIATHSDRSHEQRIRLLKQEISIIMKTIDSQRNIFQSLSTYSRSLGRSTGGTTERGRLTETIETRGSYRGNHGGDHTYHHSSSSAPHRTNADRDHSGWSRAPYRSHPGEDYPYAPAYATIASSTADFKITATDPGGFRELLLLENTLQLDRRRMEFSEYNDQAHMLEEVNRNKVDTTKDRQELAIYAFTIVTIIFLPLSSVASIFGMNTNDVRNMELDQWAYWAVAVPVTIAVIFLGLLWTGEFRNTLRWFASFGPKAKAQYAMADDLYYDDYHMAGPRRWSPGSIPPAPRPVPVNPNIPVDTMSYAYGYGR